MLETDLLIDRMRLKRHLAFWRILAVLVVVIAAGIALVPHVTPGPRIVRLSVDGIITDDRKLTDAVASLADNPRAAALIVSIDSPGGSVAGGEGLHDAIARVAARKPVVAVMRGEAASAGYMIACPAARIFARQSTITGSIGVVMQTGEVSGLLAKLGVSATQIVSGPLKGQPDPTQPLKPAARDYLQGIITDLYEQFVAIVATGRHLDPARVRALADGRAYTGHQALPLGLIDQYGGEREALVWLAQVKGIKAGTPVAELKVRSWADRYLGDRADLPGIFGAITKTLLGQGLTLDGPLALWQPDGQTPAILP